MGNSIVSSAIWNAVRHGLLHVIDFFHAPFIRRLASGGVGACLRSVSWQNAFELGWT